MVAQTYDLAINRKKIEVLQQIITLDMKNKVKIASLLLAIAGLSGCEINDPVNDWADLGQQTAYVYWELKDAVNAGSDLDFRVYYYADGSTIEKAQVWYGVSSTIRYMPIHQLHLYRKRDRRSSRLAFGERVRSSNRVVGRCQVVLHSRRHFPGLLFMG